MKKRIIFFITLSFFLTSFHLFAQDSQKQVAEIDGVKIKDDEKVSGNIMSPFQIQKLIGGKRYTEKGVIHSGKEYTKALEELYKYIDYYPERFDRAERLIRIILNRRKKYSELFDDLITYSNEHPEDLVGCGERVNDMIALEDNPPEEISRLMDVFRQMYLYKHYDNQFRIALKKSSDFAHEKEYLKAINVLESCFEFYADEFYSDWSANDEIVQEALNLRDKIDSEIEIFTNIQTTLNNDVDTFIKYINDNDYPMANAFYPTVESDLIKLAEIHNDIVGCIKRYDVLNKRITFIDPDITDAYYIPFMRRFVSGISDYSDSGILGSIAYQWNDKHKLIKDALAKHTEKLVNNYLKALPEKILSEINYEEFENKDLYVQPIVNFAELGTRVSELSNEIVLLSGKNQMVEQKYDDSLDYISGLSQQTLDVISLAEQISMENDFQTGLLGVFEVNKGNSGFNQKENLDSLFDSLDKMAEILGDKNQLVIENQPWSKGYLTLSDDEKLMNWGVISKVYSDYVDELFNQTDDALINVWDAITGTFKENADIYSNSLREYIEFAEVFHNGLPEAIDEDTYEEIKDNPQLLLEYAKTHSQQTDTNQPSDDGSENDIEDDENPYEDNRYPELTIKLTQYIQEQAEQNKESLISAQKNFDVVSQTYSERNGNEKVNEIVDESNKYIAEKVKSIDSQREDTKLKEKSAKDDYDKAIKIQAKVDSLLEEAEKAFAEGDLTLADELNEKAYAEESLSWQLIHMQKRRDEVERKYYLLSDKINEAINDTIIYNTRVAYNKARESMENNHYDEALEYIQLAIDTWAKTHKTEKNMELEYLKELILTASKLQNGRKLSPSDPLYAEMSQLLSQANIQYDRGKKLLEENKVAEANIELQDALDNLEKIKKIYPLNDDVALLKLKIKKLQLPAKEWNDYIKPILDNAASKSKEKDVTILNEVLTELEALSKVETDNKTLSKLITDLRIKLGLEEYVDTASKNKALSLEKEAKKLYDRGLYSQARDKINEAIRLDPKNASLGRTRDSIEKKIGAEKRATTNTSTTNKDNNKPAAGTSTQSDLQKFQQIYNKANQYASQGKWVYANRELMKIRNNYPSYWNQKKVQDLYNKVKGNLN